MTSFKQLSILSRLKSARLLLPFTPLTVSNFCTKARLDGNNSISDLAELVKSSHRPSLARAITLVESTNPQHQEQASQLLSHLLGHAKTQPKSFRIGISGAPGVGKSTFIERFGLYLTSLGHRVAVLAVDPSSYRTGGSILGDKTRMVELSRHPDAYIRPSPSRGSLGGVARNTCDAIVLCEAANYDVILVETVGVGQSEVAVEAMVDIFTLLVSPAAGDSLQGIKKGIMEMADVLVVTKADGELENEARKSMADYHAAFRLFTQKNPHWKPKVLTCSSLANKNVDEVWKQCTAFKDTMIEQGEFDKKRVRQQQEWLWTLVKEQLFERITHDSVVRQELTRVESDIKAGSITAGTGADLLCNTFLRPH